ncbi:MAG: beta-ketoacyl-[acyl-carrier-protein] synthase family protein [Desulfatibacillaceae bacterium]
MKAPRNRRVFVTGYGAATPLGRDFPTTWERAVRGEPGFNEVTRCEVKPANGVVGEIPDWNPLETGFADAREVSYWNAGFVILTMAVVREAMERSGIAGIDEIKPRTACFIGSALNGCDSYGIAVNNLRDKGPNHVSPFLLPNLCSNVPSGKAGALMGFTGPIWAPGGACASGNHAMGVGARMIRDGDIDFVLAGGADTPLTSEILYGFANMNAIYRRREGDRAYEDVGQASRPFSVDRKGFVLSEGCGVVVLAAEDSIEEYGLTPLAEFLGVGWTSDAYHFTKPNPPTIIRAIREALDDAGVAPEDIQYVNCHGTSTPRGDSTEVECLREVFGDHLKRMPISSNKSQMGHTLGASASIEAAMTIEGMRQGLILPTINHVPDPALGDVDVVPNETRRQSVEIALSNAFGFGGTNCCAIFRGV